ncbi:hypothetical protein GCK32_000647 [Trichostrongylus colubriformis]|uniref:EGF-like domain-containing protein n=1 Tax=Trichostrongylus colubriformis TaxID=6319 RepID=A0AAN8FIH5_TRICO
MLHPALNIVFQAIVFLQHANCYEETVKGKLLTFASLNTPISETVRYIPIGHHAFFTCEAFKKSSLMPERAKNASWLLMHRSGETWNTYELKNTISLEKSRIMVTDNNAYLYGMSSVLDGSIITCTVPSVLSSEIPDANDTTSTKELTLSSRTILVAQNCGKNGEDSTTSMNKLNPCRFGSCAVTNMSGFGLLECRCMPQYTGLYCDKFVLWATIYELLFYSPVAALLLVLLFVACCFDYVEGMRKEKPMKLEKHLPRGCLAVDLKRNYPAMFLTHEQYAEMALSLLQEPLMEDSARPPSAEKPSREVTPEKSRSTPGTAPTSKKEHPITKPVRNTGSLPKLLTPPDSVEKSEKSAPRKAKKSGTSDGK